MRFHDVVALIEARIGSLPGVPAQLGMAPMPRHGWKPGSGPHEARPAAGLVLLYPVDGEANVLLTKRSTSMLQHGGQISLPGGAVDPDETMEAAAVREANEEVALDPAVVRLIGRLTPLHIPVSGFVLHPVIAVALKRPDVRVASPEVDRIIEVPLAQLVTPEHRRRTTHTRDGVEFEIPSFDVGGEQVWGATAMVLAELVALFTQQGV